MLDNYDYSDLTEEQRGNRFIINVLTELDDRLNHREPVRGYDQIIAEAKRLSNELKEKYGY